MLFKIENGSMNFSNLTSSKKKALADEAYQWYENKYQIEIPLKEKEDFYVSSKLYFRQNQIIDPSFFSFKRVMIQRVGNCSSAFTMRTLKRNQLPRRLRC